MKKLAFLPALLLAAPLGAQTFEVGVFAGQQQYPTPHVDVLPGQTLQFKTDNKTVYGARFGYALVDIGPALLQLTAGYQPESKSTLTATLGGVPLAVAVLTTLPLSTSACVRT